jgi:hypothetical protein
VSDVQVIWDDPADPAGNTAHVAEHGLSPDEVDEVLLNNALPRETSRSSGRPCRQGWTSTGRHIFVAWDEVSDDPPIVYPVTAYETDPS